MTSLRLARNWRMVLVGPAKEAVASAWALLRHEVPSIQILTVNGYPAAGVLNPPTGQPATLCLIDAISHRDRAVDVAGELRTRRPDTPLVALASSRDPEELVSLLRVGFDDFLVEPFTVEQLDAVFHRLLRARPDLNGSLLGRVIAVAPAKGGSGASGLAIELANDSAGLGVHDAVLMDLDPFAGMAAFRLGVQTDRSFLEAEAIAQSGDLRPEAWRDLLHPVCGGAFRLLPAPGSIEEPAYRLESAAPLIEFARAQHDCLIVDAGGFLGPWNESIVREADDVLVVTTASWRALKATQRSLRHLEALGIPGRKVHVILNRYRPGRDFSLEAIETVLGREIHTASGGAGLSGLRSLRDRLAEVSPAPALTP